MLIWTAKFSRKKAVLSVLVMGVVMIALILLAAKGDTPEEQARYVQLCQKIFAEHPAVIGNFFFRWSDAETCWQCGERDCPAECAWGCVDVNENPKPAYYALKEGNEKWFS